MEEMKKKGKEADTEQEVIEEDMIENVDETVSPEQEEISRLTAEVEKWKTSSDDYKDKWIRNVAEFDNYKKRTAKNESRAYKDGKADMLKKIFFIGDSLDWALTMELEENTAEGIRQLKKKYSTFLEGEGVTEIDPIGETFDPHISEAVMQAPAEEGVESGIVKQVIQKGYRSGDEIIRVARVIVTG